MSHYFDHGRSLFLTLFILLSSSTQLSLYATTSPSPPPPPPLSSWNTTSLSRTSILRFISSVSDPNSSSFLPPSERIVVFDVDGTLLCEKPISMAILPSLEHFCEKINSSDPFWYQTCLLVNTTFIDEYIDKLLLLAFFGEDSDFYRYYSWNYLETEEHTLFNVPYSKLFYQPMYELIQFLVANNFQVYLASYSQDEFVKVLAEYMFKIPLQNAMGSARKLVFDLVGQFVSFSFGDHFVEPMLSGAGKAEAIMMKIGTAPIMAFGNTMRDYEMLKMCKFGVVINHDDVREYVYTDEQLLAEASLNNWIVVSMMNDFDILFNS